MDSVVDDPAPWFMTQYRRVLHHHLEKTARSAKTLTALGFVGALIPALASGQSVQDLIINPNPPPAPLEKSIGYYTSTTIPSIAVGASPFNGSPGGLYLYTSSGDLSGPWTQTVIDPSGDFYERAVPFLYQGDTYPGIMASRSGQLVWYFNPRNWGGDPTQPWFGEVINPNAGCHDVHVLDVDGDGKPDVVCSATFYGPSQSFIAYQNSFDNWQIVTNPFLDPSGNGIGDSVALVSINGSSRTNVVGASPTGVYWFQNPGSNRSGHWTPHFVGTGGSTNDIGETAIGTVPYGGSSDAIIVGSSEEPTGPWPPGLVAFTSTNGGRSWSVASLDSTYRTIHEINGGNQLGPFFIVAEQEQVAPACNSHGFNEHPANDNACRVTLFQYKAGAFVPTLELSSLGTQNQAYVAYNNGIAVAGANHNFYGATDPALHLWFLTAGSPGGLANGTYRISMGGNSVDGGFGYWGGVPQVQLYPNNSGMCQKWTWNGATWLNNCPNAGNGPWIGHYMADAGNGTVSEPTGTPDTWTVTASGSGWIVQNNRSKRYLSDNNGTLQMSTTRTVWMIGSQ